MNKKKILVVGSFSEAMSFHTTALKKALKQIGCTVEEFNWEKFSSKNLIIRKIEDHFLVGPKLLKCNRELIRRCLKNDIQYVFIYRGTHIYSNTIKKIKKTGAIVSQFNNDNPFGELNNRFFWRHYKKNCVQCDLVYAFRNSDINEYTKLGVGNCKILFPYYIKTRTFPVDKKDIPSQYLCDVVFIGHYEDDGRDKYLYNLVKQGINVKIYGDTEWNKSQYYNFFNKKCGEIRLAVIDYNLAINGAKIAVSFLSKWNKDTHTRRCFEIPSTRTMMLCEYTDVLNNIFKDNIEVAFFKNEDEFYKKTLFLLNNEVEREKIALNGQKRCEKEFEVEKIAEVIVDDFKWLKKCRKN